MNGLGSRGPPAEGNQGFLSTSSFSKPHQPASHRESPQETLIINAGSSSVKMRLYRGNEPLFEGLIDGIGGKALIETSFSFGPPGGTLPEKQRVVTRVGSAYAEENAIRMHVPDYETAGKVLIEMIRTFSHVRSITTVVHRVVHGGNLKEACVITPSVFKQIEKLSELAPLHQPHSIKLITFFMKSTKAQHIACFDTAFHQTMPHAARTYALPENLVKKYGIIRYGFHGLSHHALLQELEGESGKKFSRVITCQLGNGVSMCAIHKGKSIDTTMGFTPLEGLPMGTRSGSIDPAIVAFLSKHEKKSFGDIIHLLEQESGFKGLTGDSDVRKIRERAEKGDRRAILALDYFTYQLRKQMGAYISVLGGLDALVLGGGMSRAPMMRELILQNLEHLGIVINSEKIKNEAPVKVSKGKVQVWALETDEQGYMFDLSREL